jgi:hypothetical protein
VKWLGILTGRNRAAAELAPKVSDLVELAPPSDREVRIVREVASHVASKVVPIVEMHGRRMETALQANVMAIEVATRLALEACQRTALTAVVIERASLDMALFKLDCAIETITLGLKDHRNEIAAAVEATHAGIVGGQVFRP